MIKNFLKSASRAFNRLISLIEWKTQGLYKKIFKNKSKKTVVREVIMVVLIAGVLFATIFTLWAASLKTPDLHSFDDRLLGQSAKIYDRTGTVLLYDLSQKVRRTVVPFDTISPYIKNATIAIEDIDFYNHKGIKVTSIIRAVLANILTLEFSQGGSTITQQVVKNSLLTKDKDISRKLKEWILAIKLERSVDKNTILNLYLNDSPYGGNMYGIEEASQMYFAKKSSDVTLAEAAYLAALPQAPSLYSPYGKNKHLLVDRKNLVLKKMYENKMITEEEYSNALKEEVVFQPKTVGSIKAAHFVMYIKDYLETKYGQKMLETGGFKVITTIDYEIQAKAEETVKKYVLANEGKFKASNGAMVVTNPKTGEILAMVGSRDYFDKNIDGNFNVATAHRQPGSSFKPFVYATAFSEGLTPDTPVYDVPTEFNSSCSTSALTNTGENCYNPQNYEGGYKGLMSIRKALAESRNIPAVRTLHVVGVEDTLKTARAMGIEDLGSASDYGLSLALGGGEVSLLDMTSAYGVFANGGLKAKTTGILRIETNEGVEIEAFATSTKQVIPEQSALLISDVLSDPYARAALFGSGYFGNRQVALKTGTTNNSRDAWMLGFTPSVAMGAWMGNNKNTPMAQQSSARIIGPMWKEFMDWLITRVPDETFEKPEPYSSDLKPFLTGEWQGPGTEVHSELFWINRNDPAGAAPGYGSTDPLFRHFEAGVQNWAATSGAGLIDYGGGTNTPGGSQTASGIRIASPLPNAVLSRNGQAIVNVSGYTADTAQVEFYVNNILVGKSTQAPFSFAFVPGQISGIQDENELKVVETQRLGKYTEATTAFSIQ